MTGKIIQLINGCFMFEVSGNGGKNKVLLLSNKNDYLYTFLACDFFLSAASDLEQSHLSVAKAVIAKISLQIRHSMDALAKLFC